MASDPRHLNARVPWQRENVEAIDFPAVSRGSSTRTDRPAGLPSPDPEFGSRNISQILYLIEDQKCLVCRKKRDTLRNEFNLIYSI